MNRFHKNFNELINVIRKTPICGFICLASLAGCSDRAGVPVNLNVAQQTLASAMESWKDGKTPQDLVDSSPSIFVQEMDWNDGATLLEYEIVDDNQPAGPNLIASVKLRLSNADGQITEKTATYVVGTSPKLTVYRNLMK